MKSTAVHLLPVLALMASYKFNFVFFTFSWLRILFYYAIAPNNNSWIMWDRKFRNLTLVCTYETSRPPKIIHRFLNCMIENIEENILLNFLSCFEFWVKIHSNNSFDISSHSRPILLSHGTACTMISTDHLQIQMFIIAVPLIWLPCWRLCLVNLSFSGKKQYSL